MKNTKKVFLQNYPLDFKDFQLPFLFAFLIIRNDSWDKCPEHCLENHKDSGERMGGKMGER